MSAGLTPARRCAYCPAELVPSPQGGCHMPNAATRDHVIPRAMLRQLVGPLPPSWHTRNKLWACARCNCAKGCMHPLEWLARIDYQPARDRLASRLVMLGLPADTVNRARRSVVRNAIPAALSWQASAD